MSEEPIRIRGIYRSPTHLPIWEVLDKAGIWRDVGIEVAAFEYCNSSATTEEALFRGDIDFVSGWRHIARAFGDIARMAQDAGLRAAVHPHTGTLLETRQDIDAFFDAADTDLLPFAPDTGQIAKAGDDPVATLEDYKAIIRHVHLKDYGGGRDTGYLGYAPIGEGVIDMPAIFRILDDVGFDGWVTVELDGTPDAPYTPLEAARKSRDYLARILGDQVAWTTR